MAAATSLSLLPSTLSPKLSSSSILFSSAHFQPRTTISLFWMKTAAVSASSDYAVGEDLPLDYGELFPQADPSVRRRAGVVLHPTSSRGPYGIGDLGEEAFRFVDLLHEAGFKLWKVLPLVPPGRKANDTVDVANLGAQDKKQLMESILKVVEDDSEKFLQRLQARNDRVGIKVPKVEV